MKRKRYDDKFRASACVMLEAQGYPGMKGALQHVADHLNVPAMTLSRWFKARQNPPPNELVSEKRGDLADIFENLAYKMLAHAGREEVIDAMTGKDATIAAATATDKMRLLRGLPTEIIEVVPAFVEALTRIGKDPKVFMDRVIERANQERIQ